ncbi:MAG: dihydroneopterin aldolase, partial [Campylobacterota bacterium]
MTIHIEDLKFQCIIGILDFERVTPQDVIINLAIEYDYKKNFINYADVVEIVKN